MEEGGEDDIEVSPVTTMGPEIVGQSILPNKTDDILLENNTDENNNNNTQSPIKESLPNSSLPIKRRNKNSPPLPKNNIIFEEWHCPNCNKNNYIGRSHCKRCLKDAPPSVALKRKREAPTPLDEVESIIATTLLEVTGMADGHHRADLFQMNMIKGCL